MEITNNSDVREKTIDFRNDICTDGICCFMSIPKDQRHLGMWRKFLKRRNASYGIKLLYTAINAKDIFYNPCKCLNFFIHAVDTPNGSGLQITLRCAIFGKKCRPYTCNNFPEKEDSFVNDVSAPCVYNEYTANEIYVALKHKHVFRLHFAIKDDNSLLKKISPGLTVDEIREKLNQCPDVVKISAVWNEKPAEYFLFEVPKKDTVLYISKAHPKIKSVKQAYKKWSGHIETWLDKHYGSKWEDYLKLAIQKEEEILNNTLQVQKKDTKKKNYKK